jgi:hypothetical protein
MLLHSLPLGHRPSNVIFPRSTTLSTVLHTLLSTNRFPSTPPRACLGKSLIPYVLQKLSSLKQGIVSVFEVVIFNIKLTLFNARATLFDARVVNFGAFNIDSTF